MASLWKHPTSQYFFACFTLPDGRRTKRSTKLTDRKAAQKMADRWDEAARMQVTKDQARRVISDIYQSLHSERLESATVRGFFDRWLAAKKQEARETTFAKYQGVVRQFLALLDSKQDRDLSNLTKEDIVRFRDTLSAKLSPTTVNTAIKIIRTGLQQAYCDSLIDLNPATKVKAVSASRTKTHKRAFTLPELQRLLNAADDEWKGMILAGVYTGQRLGDIARLTWQNVDLDKKEIRFVTQKTGRPQVIPMTSRLHRHFVDSVPAGDTPSAPIFPNANAIMLRGNDRTGALSNQFYSLMVEVGLVESRTHQKKKNGQGRSARRTINELGFHALRHTATSLLKNAGVSDVVARDIIGHDSVAVSRNYTHIEEETKRAALDALPELK